MENKYVLVIIISDVLDYFTGYSRKQQYKKVLISMCDTK